jgi:RNA polymerase sigma-70 factor (ECF subfamily)
MTTYQDTLDLNALGKRLHNRARRLGAQPCDAEDMAQEALLRLIQRNKRSGVEEPAHYAMIILQNLARARWRAQVDLDELEENSASTAPVADSRLALSALYGAIDALPHEQREVMALVLQGEFSPRVMAQRLGVPVGTVMSRLARARVKLRAQIGLDAGTPVADLL